MRSIFATAALVFTSALAGCSDSTDDESAASGSEVSTPRDASPPTKAACSLTYWRWVYSELRPALARPIGEVSDAQMTALVAKHPLPGSSLHSYAVCWQPVFAEHFFAPAAARLWAAAVGYSDAKSPSYKSLSAYRTNVALTPELRRNAKALLSLKPATMQPVDVGPWLTAYNTILAGAIAPVGIPGPNRYEDVAESEWIVDDKEAEYLSVVERAAGTPERDGNYGEWFRSVGKWLFGPPPGVSSSVVFNLAWEQGSTASSYDGLAGVVIGANGKPTIPAPVQAFLDRVRRTQPKALGAEDSAAWINGYAPRGLRALSNLSQNDPIVTATDALALDVLESLKPAAVRGAFSFDHWLELVERASHESDKSWLARFAAFEPCLDAADLAKAKERFAATPLPGAGIAPPNACK